jgi:hypothetical protein
MTFQLDLPATPSTEPAPPAVRVIGQSRPEEPAVPVYRHFLSGGVGEYRLGSGFSLGLAAASTVAVLGGLWLVGRIPSPAATHGLAISAALVCVPLAALVTRWAGRSSGMLAGLLAMVGWMILSCYAAPLLMIAAASGIASILAYALAELPHRNPILSRTQGAVVFYIGVALSCALIGPAPLVPIAAVCLGTVLGNENSRGIRFFASPVGLAVLGVGIAIRIITAAAGPPADLWPQWPAATGLAAAVAWTWASVRTGHAASPLGRLLMSWLLGPCLLATVGAISVPLACTIALPAWAAAIAPVVVALWRRLRRRLFLVRLPETIR